MLNQLKSKSVFARLKDKWLKFTVLGFLGALIVVGLVVGLNALNQYFKIAQAEDIVATAPVSGNYTANLILSPDDSTAYVSNSGYTATPGISKYNTADNTLTSFIAIGENQTILNSTGTKLYAFTSTDIKVIDASSFSIESTIATPNVGAGFLSNDDSKLFVVTATDVVTVFNTSDNSIITTIETLLPSSSNGITTLNSASLNGLGVLNNDKTKLYLIGNYNTAEINISTNTFEGLIPVDAANSSINARGVSISKDDTKMYAPDPTGFRVIDLATRKLERIIVGSRADFIQSKADKIYVMDSLRKIKVYDSQTYKLTSENTIFTDLTNLQINSLQVSPDSSKIYITGIRSGGVTYVGNPLNLTPIFGPSDNFLMVVDLNTFEVNVNGGFNSNAKIQRFSSDGKRAYITDEGSYKVVDTTLVNTFDILSFDCTSPTDTLGSVVTCTVNTSNNVRGLVKFDVGLESCTAYFPAAGGNIASCTYVANNIQSSDVIIYPSFGNPSTNGTLTINGEANDVTIGASNIVSNNNCTASGNVKLNAEFNCSFSLSGSSSDTYILPSGGIIIGVIGVSVKSDLCLIIGNGTSNPELDCKNIPTVDGPIGTQGIQVFINNSISGANVGNINLTDGFLVNATTDNVDVIPGDGYCGDLNGDCTLRAAVMEANSDYLKDKITIPAGVYQLTISPTDTPNVSENKGAIDGDLDITTDIDFIGAGKDTTFIQAGTNVTNGIDRVFHVFKTKVNFNDLTIRYGRVENKSFVNSQFQNLILGGNGGGIYYQQYRDFDANPENSINIYGYNSEDYLTVAEARKYDPNLNFQALFNLNNVAVSDNYAQNSGGGIYDSSYQGLFTNVEIQNNSSGKYGGGLSRSTIYDRETKQIVEQIFAILDTKLELINTKILNNQSIDGAGLYHDRGNKIVIDENSVISSNTASGNGGGIFNTECSFAGGVQTISIYGSTINSNTANNGGAVYNQCGHVETLPGNLTSKNTTIQFNNVSGNGSAWFGTENSLNEMNQASIYENNTQNSSLDYASGQSKSVVWLEKTARLNVTASMILGNWGRGIEFNDSAKVNIDRSTIANNSGRGISYSTNSGSGVAELKAVNSTFTTNNSSGITFRLNTVTFNGSHLTLSGNAFGLIFDPGIQSFNLDNTIVSGSATKNCGDLTGADFTSSIGSIGRGKNLSNNSDCNQLLGFTENADVANFLGPLQFNGGPTLTIELFAGNPAIDGGSGSPTYDGQPESPATDQRQEPRPAGANYDIGAFEVQVLSPRANDDNVSTDPNSAVSVDVLANDTPGTDPINTNSVTIVDQPTKGSLNDDGNGNFTYIPDSGQFSATDTDTFTYYFLDDLGIQSNTATVTITVNVPVVNIAPTANDDVASGNEIDSIVIDILANDSDSDGTLDLASVFIQDQPQKGNLSIDNGNGQVTYTPNSSLYTSAGSDTFTYKVKDNSGDFSNLATVTVNITPQSKIISASCDPRFGYLTITSNCTAEFTAGRSGTITFTNSVSSCTTNSINLTDTNASCSFTISTPSINPYEVELTSTQGETLNSIDSIFVSPLPSLVSMTPDSGPITGGTSTIADLSMIPGNERNFAVSTDQSGNIYVAGEVFGTIKAGNNYLNSNGGEDIYVAKYDSNQNLIWAKLAGGTGNDRATGLVVDGGDVYITGYFKSVAKFGSTTLSSRGNNDVFVSKLDSSGNWIWTTSGGGVAADEAHGIDKDANGNVYIAGRINAAGDFSGSAQFGNNTLVTNGLTDVFVSKLDSSGNWIWTTRGGGSAFDFAESISVSNNSVYISGTYNNNTTIGSTNLVLDMGRTGYNSYLAKLDNNGNWLWAKDIGNTGVDTFAQDFAYSGEVYTDSAGNAYIMGSFYKDYIDFGTAGVINNSSTKTVAQRLAAASAGEGIAQHYIAKASPDGNWLWATQLGQTAYGFSSSFEALNNSTGYVVTTLYDSDINLAGQAISKTNSFYNSIIAKIDLSDGTLSNITPSSGTNGSEIIRDIATDPDGNLVLVGNSSGLSKFDQATYQSSGLFDSTILKYETTTNTFSSMTGLGGIVPFFVDFATTLNSVKFDGLNAIITSINSPIQATVVSPAHPVGFVDVEATNSLSYSSVLNNGYEYTPLPITYPVAINDSATVNQNESITINVLANDSDPSGQTLTICTPLSTPSNGSIVKTIVAGVEQIIFTPVVGYSGSATFTYTACDPAGNASNIATVNITVAPNNAPIANADSVSTIGSTPIPINVPANDSDSDGSLDLSSVIIVTDPNKGTVSVNPTNGIVTYTATTASFTTNGSDTFTYRIKDNDGDFSNITTVTVNVTVNPVANPDNASTTVPNPVTINVSTNDTKVSADLDLASVTIVTQPTKGTVIVNTTAGSPDLGKVTYAPNSTSFTTSGSDTFTYYIKDLEDHTSNTTTVNISVVFPGSNQIPVANSDTATGNKNNPITVNVPTNDTDSDGTLDLSSVTIVTQPTKGTISVNPTTGAITYTPTPSSYSASSTDTFTYKIKDNDGEFSNVAIVTLNINLTLPVAINDTATTDQDKPITVEVLANDINAANICQNSVQTTTTNGTTSFSNNKVIYTPKKDFSGTDSFTYKACNADGESNPATITITVKAAPPVIQPVVVQNVDLKIYKNTPTDQIILSKPVQIQADIKNPNNFTVEKIETIITIDTSKVEFVRDSARQGTIDGTKYTNILNILDTLGINGNAATNTTLEFISDSQLKVTSFNLAPGETIPVVFSVIPKANIQNSITGKADIINPITNQSLAQAQARTDLKPVEFTPILVRTGGEILWIGLGLISLIGVVVFGNKALKRLKVRVK